MELNNLKEKTVSLLSKYRYVLLVLTVGVLLMLIPGAGKKDTPAEAVPAVQPGDNELHSELEEILSQIKGAGKVCVLLTEKSGTQTHYQQDAEISTGENGTQRQETVIVTGSDRAQAGLVQRIDPPVYMGAIIVCQGADSAAVRLGIIEAVSRITGLGSDRISVLKMK